MLATHGLDYVFLGLGEWVALIKAFPMNLCSLTARQLWTQTVPGDSSEEDRNLLGRFVSSFREELLIETEDRALWQCSDRM